MSGLIKCEAFVLQALPFKEIDRILTLFSPQGLIKLFAKGKKRDLFHFAALTSPLTCAEFLYSLGRKDLHRFHEGSIIDQNIRLRERYETVMAAEKMVRALLDSQWIGKPAPHLFHLFFLFIQHLPSFKDPTSLATTFFIKLLAHEGVLHICEENSSNGIYRYAGERYSSKEAPSGAIPFSEAEEALLIQLATCRSLAQLMELHCAIPFQEKIETLVHQTFDCYCPTITASR